jgi:hypothetical protein
MSNYDVIAAHYRASDQGDLDAMLAPLATDVAWTEMAGFPYAGTYRGPQAVREGVFERIGAEWNDYRFSLDELHASGDLVFGIGTYSGVFRATGRSMSARVVHVWRLRDGAVVAFEQFTDTTLVQAAVA